MDYDKSLFCEDQVFEHDGKLYEDLRSFLHEEWNKDLVEDNIKFRVIFGEDDYDYVIDQQLTDKLEKFRA
jgi:hypothetical protein